MRQIELANGRGVPLVDTADYALLSRYKWSFQVDGKRRYAVTYYQEHGRGSKPADTWN